MIAFKGLKDLIAFSSCIEVILIAHLVPYVKVVTADDILQCVFDLQRMESKLKRWSQHPTLTRILVLITSLTNVQTFLERPFLPGKDPPTPFLRLITITRIFPMFFMFCTRASSVEEFSGREKTLTAFNRSSMTSIFILGRMKH